MTKTASTRRSRASQSPEHQSVAPDAAPPRRYEPSLTDYLTLLESYYQPELAEMPWASEDDRWAELLFCLLYEANAHADAALARGAVVTLRYLGLSTIESLREMDTPADGTSSTGEPAAAVIEILRRHGFEDPARVTRMLAQTAHNVQKAFGRIQLFLYNKGQSMIDELTEVIGSEHAPTAAVRASAALWFQNTLNLPVIVENPQIAALRTRFGVSAEELVNAADEVGINVAILDDLVTLADGDEEFQAWLEAALSYAGSADSQ